MCFQDFCGNQKGNSLMLVNYSVNVVVFFLLSFLYLLTCQEKKCFQALTVCMKLEERPTMPLDTLKKKVHDS